MLIIRKTIIKNITTKSIVMMTKLIVMTTIGFCMMTKAIVLKETRHYVKAKTIVIMPVIKSIMNSIISQNQINGVL